MFSIPKGGWLSQVPGVEGGSYTCDGLQNKRQSAAASDLAMEGDRVRSPGPEDRDFHGAQAPGNCETVSFLGPVSLLDLYDKLLIDPIRGHPVQTEAMPADLGHYEVSQIWNLFCMRTQSCRVTKKRNCMQGFR